jgi:hypothetical protein
MTTVAVALPGPIPVILSGRFVIDIDNRVTSFLQEVNHLAGQGVLPVTLATADSGWRMAIYAARYVAWLYPTRGGDAYNLGHAARRQFRDEERLLAAALLLRCPYGFIPFPDLRTLNNAVRAGQMPHTTVGAEQLRSAWRSATAASSRPAASPSAPARYLDLLDLVVDASCQIETQRQEAAPPQHYVSHESAREERYSARGVYRFNLTGRCELTTNMMVHPGGLPEVRGRVTRIESRQVTVRFEPGADYARIPSQGTLRALASVRVFRAQREAIAQIRQGKSRNPRLLSNLLDADFLPYHPATDDSPRLRRDPTQLTAFRRALTVPDMLCVLGPPGTGKTTTIVEVVQACVAMGQRVLVTSHTHRAVDNVLEGLPLDINLVRIGSEDRMTTKIRALSSESRAEAVRREIKADSSLYDALCAVRRQVPVLDRYVASLATLLDRARATSDALHQLETDLPAAIRRVSGPLLAPLDQAERALNKLRLTADRQSAALAAGERRLAALRDCDSRLAFVYRWLAGRQERRIGRTRGSLLASRSALATAESDVVALRSRAEQAAAHDPLVARLQGDRADAERTLSELWPDLTHFGEHVVRALRPVVAVPAVPPPTIVRWQEFSEWCVSTLLLVGRRADLLGEWRKRIDDVSDELEREIARYAQVVGATCIGTDTSALISHLEFDLAIVDEAGQISTPNLLVPLVKSRRALLVGDHHQLPPFLDEDVRRWAAQQAVGPDLTRTDLQQVTELLDKSGFEMLFPHTPPANAVWLRTQRRMPDEIASFVSSAFYEGRLRTEHPGGTVHSLFASPFAMVDTSDRSSIERAETAVSGLQEMLRHGYRNELEADIIAQLVDALHGDVADWAVIVPFNAQKELIIQRLNGISFSATDNVGTVDAFQGGERDLIIFGFTRSNPRGDIGFLRELRRFNVAITRAKRQLVLVGDLSTLRQARDDGLRDLVGSMVHHLSVVGDCRPSLELTAALRAVSEGLA